MATVEELLKQAQKLNEAKEYEQVIELLTDDSLKQLRNADLYAELAQAYFRTLQYDLSELAADYSIALKENVIAYFYKGACNYVTKNHELAFTCFQKAIELDPTYAHSYNGLGNIYSNRKDYNSAISCYIKAIKLNSNLPQPYNGLGNIYYTQKEYDEAIKYYQKAIDIDPEYEMSYYNRGLVLYSLERYADALVDFNTKIQLSKNNSDISIQYAKAKVDEIKKILENIDYKNIADLVYKIKSLLLHNDGYITHYTGFSIAQLLILHKNLFRLSEGAFLNDTSEGRVLFDFIGFHSVATKQLKDTEAKPFAQKPFIGSFVAETKHDDLALWRMYGKDSNIEAKGCAITIDAQALLDNINNKLFPDGKATSSSYSGDDLKFYRVAYETQDNHFIIPCESDEEKKLHDQKLLNDYMLRLKDRVGEFNKNMEAKEDKEYRDKRIKDVLELLNDIAYLFKSAEYQYEKELRLVVKKGIGFEKIVEYTDDKQKVYIELVEITPLIRKITFGPKVDRRAEWAAIFYYTLEKDGHKPDIYISHLPFK